MKVVLGVRPQSNVSLKNRFCQTRSAGAVVTKVVPMRVAVAAMVVVIVGAPGRCVSTRRGSSGGDCVGKYWCRGLVKIEYCLVFWPFLAVLSANLKLTMVYLFWTRRQNFCNILENISHFLAIEDSFFLKMCF